MGMQRLESKFLKNRDYYNSFPPLRESTQSCHAKADNFLPFKKDGTGGVIWCVPHNFK